MNAFIDFEEVTIISLYNLKIRKSLVEGDFSYIIRDLKKMKKNIMNKKIDSMILAFFQF